MTENNEREASVRALAEKLLLGGLPPEKAFLVADEFVAIGEQRAAVQIQIHDPLESIGISARAINAARSYGVTEVGQLVAMTMEDLLAWRNCGELTAKEIVRKLAEHGWSLRRSIPRRQI